MLITNGIQSINTTIKNPQSNAICERMHQTVENMIWTRLHKNTNTQPPTDFIDTILADTVFDLRASVHQTMKTTPSILAFHRDMLLNIPTFTDLKHIQYMWQQQVNKDVQGKNKNRNKYQFKTNDQVLITPSRHIQWKLNPKFSGPYTITDTHENNIITIKRKNNIMERTNIWRVKPYHKEE
jgi:hypothetical protein